MSRGGVGGGEEKGLDGCIYCSHVTQKMYVKNESDILKAKRKMCENEKDV